MRFSKKLFVMMENEPTNPSLQNSVAVVIERYGDLSTTVSVAYATSDVTAVGNAPNLQAACSAMGTQARHAHGCGDYAHVSGIMTFLPTEFAKEVRVFACNDECNENYMEYFKVQLGVPGGDALVGEDYTAFVRIDDDDDEKAHCMPRRTAKRSRNYEWRPSASDVPPTVFPKEPRYVVPPTLGKTSMDAQY